MRSQWLRVLTGACLLSLVSGAAAADEARILTDRWYLTVGGYLAEISTDASVGTGSVVGTVIRAEDQLGLDDNKSTFRLVAERRFGKHGLGLEYFDIARSGEAMLEESIQYQGNTYDVGAMLESSFDSELIQLTYRYAFVNDGKTEAGIQTGLSAWKLATHVAGEATIDDGMGGVTQEFREAGKDVLAPVPSIGLFLRHAFSPRWVFSANARFMRLGLGDVEGRLVDTSLSLDYFFSRHVGAGFGINGTDMRYDDEGDKPLLMAYRQNGAVVYLSLVF